MKQSCTGEARARCSIDSAVQVAIIAIVALVNLKIHIENAKGFGVNGEDLSVVLVMQN